MTGAEHYAKAEQYLSAAEDLSAEDFAQPEEQAALRLDRQALIEAAAVHAQLATAAAIWHEPRDYRRVPSSEAPRPDTAKMVFAGYGNPLA